MPTEKRNIFYIDWCNVDAILINQFSEILYMYDFVVMTVSGTIAELYRLLCADAKNCWWLRMRIFPKAMFKIYPHCQQYLSFHLRKLLFKIYPNCQQYVALQSLPIFFSKVGLFTLDQQNTLHNWICILPLLGIFSSIMLTLCWDWRGWFNEIKD